MKFTYNAKSLVDRDLFRDDNLLNYCKIYEDLYPERCDGEYSERSEFIEFVGQRVLDDMKECYKQFLEDNYL